MSTANTYHKLRAWAKTSGQGILIPGSVQFRKTRPVGKGWHELTLNYCCGDTGDSYLVVINNTASANITSVVSSHGDINWTGTLTNGEVQVLVIPQGHDESIQFTVNTPTGRTLTVSSSDADATPTSLTGAAINTTPIVLSSYPNGQTVVKLS